jgi:acyl dehydratase
MGETESETGYSLPLGTLEDARAMIGQRTPLRWADAEVSRGRIQQFCAMTHDGNPAYWDGDIAPPAMLEAWLMPLEWSPSSARPQPRLPACIPLPGHSMINGSNDTTFHRHVRIGDRLSVEEELLSVSDLKKTRLGDGHFVETLSVYRNQDGDLVAEVRNTLFRFTPRDES